ncbi:hypothetical protein [Streptomyces sp. NRRL S-455]|uniref:hypothetical protein n=1 Tax=Streptomyces sp. NRRL S-455 TaxID=1463908 RepID=UPI0004BE794C|nr:hypothetical protein [Streptomyces sp. NRRL S-455]
MQTIWTRWDLADMQDAADAEGHTALDALVVPELKLVGTLPYSGALTDYREHITACADCRRDDRPDCRTGEALLAVSRIGVEEQHRMAVHN